MAVVTRAQKLSEQQNAEKMRKEEKRYGVVSYPLQNQKNEEELESSQEIEANELRNVVDIEDDWMMKICFTVAGIKKMRSEKRA